MGKRSKTAGGTVAAEAVTLHQMNQHIETLEWRCKQKMSSSLRKSAFKYLVWLEAERERVYGVPAPERRIPR